MIEQYDHNRIKIDKISDSDIESWRSGILRPVAGIGIPEIDEYIRFKRNFTIVGGISNTGKTTTMLYIMLLWSMFHEEHPKWVVSLSENDNVETMVMLIEFYKSKKIVNMSREEVLEAKTYIDQYFIFMNNDRFVSHEQLFVELGTMYNEGMRFDGVFLDPYSGFRVELNRGESPYSYVFRIAARMRKMTKSINIKTILSHHPNTESARRMHSKDDNDFMGESVIGHTKPMRPSDFEMGTVWQNRADDVLMFHRYVFHERLKWYSLIDVAKVKQVRTGGKPTSMGQPIVFEMKPDLTGYLIGGVDYIKEWSDKIVLKNETLFV